MPSGRAVSPRGGLGTQSDVIGHRAEGEHHERPHER